MRADTPAIPLFEINVNVATSSNVQGLVIPPNEFLNFGTVYLTNSRLSNGTGRCASAVPCFLLPQSSTVQHPLLSTHAAVAAGVGYHRMA